MGPYRHEPFLAALAPQTDLPWRHQLQITPQQAGHLADPRAAIVEKKQQRMIAPALTGPSIGGLDDGPNIMSFKVVGRSKSRPFRWQRQHLCVTERVVKVVAQKVFEEAAQRGTAAVARGGGIGPCGLEMIQKRSDHIGVEIVQPERGDLAVLTLGHEQQQQLERIAIGADRVRARAALAGQIVGEKGLDESEKRL